MNYMITYQKGNGDIFFRGRKTLYGMRVGDETSMGWKVLNIHYKYEGNYYTIEDLRRIINGKSLKRKKEKKFLKYIIRQLNKLV